LTFVSLPRRSKTWCQLHSPSELQQEFNMGTSKRKRTKGTPQREPFRWSIQETAALLAWADRCFELELDFKNTIAQQLKQKWPQRDYKYDVIENKVKRLWARMGNHGTDKLDIIREGTQCLDLDCFDDDERKAFHEARSEFPSRERRLRSRARSKVNSPRAEPFHASARSRSITVSPVLERGGSRVHPKIENDGAYRRSPRIAKRVGSSVRVSRPFPFIRFSAPNSRGSYRPGHHRPRNPGRPRGAQYGFGRRFLAVTMLMHKRMVRSPSTCYQMGKGT